MMRQMEIEWKLFLLTGLNYHSLRRKFNFNSQNILMDSY